MTTQRAADGTWMQGTFCNCGGVASFNVHGLAPTEEERKKNKKKNKKKQNKKLYKNMKITCVGKKKKTKEERRKKIKKKEARKIKI
jgi:hypothetical protein